MFALWESHNQRLSIIRHRPTIDTDTDVFALGPLNIKPRIAQFQPGCEYLTLIANTL